MSAHMDRLKLIVVGDCGVGKTSFVHGVTCQTPLNNPSSTIGCNVEVLAYTYDGNGSRSREVFLEFWDVGGSSGHRNSRSFFYNNIDGLIVVHDLSNRKSFLNLAKWVREVLNSGKQELTGITVGSGTDRRYLDNSYDEDDIRGPIGSVPVLVVGTKEDQNSGTMDQANRSARHIGLTEESDVTFFSINCLQEGQLSTSSNKWNHLHLYFSKVIENRFNVTGNRRLQESNSEYWRGRKKMF